MMKKQPKLARWFLILFINKYDHDSLIGDFVEIYQIYLKDDGRFRAELWLWSQIIKSIPSFINNLIYWSLIMFENYVKIAYRNLFKNKLSAFINIFGLSIAIGCSIVVFLFIDFQYGKDAFHENAEQIFLIENIIDRNGRKQIWGDTPTPLGPALQADLPQIKRVVRVADGSGVVRYKDNVFDEGIRYVDEEFLDMFTFPMKYGNKDALSDKNAVIITEELALKYFGDEDPMGKPMTITFQDKYTEEFFVKGVAEKLPKKASFGFNILMTYDKQLDVGVENFTDWKKRTRATFIQVNHPDEIRAIQTQMTKYIKIQNEADTDWPIAGFLFDNVLNLSLNSYKVRGDISRGGAPVERIVLSTIGILLLMLACFNYMNIAIASSGRRLKEIGIRKVAGSSKFQLVNQFLGENILLCLIALILGIILGDAFFVPAFSSLFDILLELNFSENIRLWIFFPALLLLTGLCAGAYPAFYISAFQPVSIFRGKQKLGGRNLFTRILLTFQFVLSILAIITGVLFTQNAEYQRNRDWGYNQEQTIVVPLNGKKHYTMYKNEVSQNPNILNIAGSRNHIGKSRGLAVVDIEGAKYEINRFDVGFDYFDTIGLRLKEGRTFDKDLSTDIEQSVIVNETFAENMKWEDALDKRMVYDNTIYHVIGVVKDFHDRRIYVKIEPTMLRLTTEDKFNYLSMRVKAGTVTQTSDYLKEKWKKLIPDAEYKGFFQDEVFDSTYRENEGINKVWMFLSSVTLIISCMGLFGLVSLNIAKRMKEISIRKVLGATILDVAQLINKEFVQLMIIATIIAVPLSYLMLKTLLDSVYEYHVALGALPFALAILSVFLTAVLTISSQVYKAAVANPVEALRSE